MIKKRLQAMRVVSDKLYFFDLNQNSGTKKAKTQAIKRQRNYDTRAQA